MKYGQFNYHKIMYSLEIFSSAEEKRAYLLNINSELDKVIKCFEMPKSFPLRNYADSGFTNHDSCSEFCDFISLMVDKYSPSYFDKRIPSNDQLLRLVEQETFEYKKLKAIVQGLLKKIESELLRNGDDSLITNAENNSNDETEKIVWNSSVEDLQKLFILLDEQNLIKDVPNEIKLNFVKEFIVDKDGQKINIKFL